jgi:hypothetical protein
MPLIERADLGVGGVDEQAGGSDCREEGHLPDERAEWLGWRILGHEVPVWSSEANLQKL